MKKDTWCDEMYGGPIYGPAIATFGSAHEKPLKNDPAPLPEMLFWQCGICLVVASSWEKKPRTGIRGIFSRPDSSSRRDEIRLQRSGI
jgi:hypothetical protein